MDLPTEILQLGKRAKIASRALARLSSAQKNAGLHAMADALVSQRVAILAANALDVDTARESGLSDAMIDRLQLDEKRLAAMADGMRAVAALDDPVGETIRAWTRPNGLEINKVRVPIGVVGIIYESRPNVTSDAAVLCTKTGNAAILRGRQRVFAFEPRYRRRAPHRGSSGGGARRQHPPHPSRRPGSGPVAGGDGSLRGYDRAARGDFAHRKPS